MEKPKLTRYRLLFAFPVALLAALVLFLPAALAAAAEAPPPAPPAPGWSMGDVMALIALIIAGAGMLIDAARAILHFTAPRTATTWDDNAAAALDDLHSKLTDIEARLPPKPSSSSGPVAVLALVLLGLGAPALLPACGGTTSTRASTISSLQTGIQTASASLRAYEHEHANAIIDAAPDKATGVAQLRAFRGKVDKVWTAVDVARAAIDAANTVNDDTSLLGARDALANALTAIAALTGGTP